jgi:hypothetical protein
MINVVAKFAECAMKLGHFESSCWDEPRHPMVDEEADRLRRDRYWAWSNAAGPDLPDGSPQTIMTTPAGDQWVSIKTPAQADWEAYRMQHSIGYNLEHYAQMGDIYSLRAADRSPTMTILVASATGVHARGPSNATLDDAALQSLTKFATAMRWNVAERTSL